MLTYCYAILFLILGLRMKKKPPRFIKGGSGGGKGGSGGGKGGGGKGKKIWDTAQFLMLVVALVLVLAAPFFVGDSVSGAIDALFGNILGLFPSGVATAGAVLATLGLASAFIWLGFDFFSDLELNKGARVSLMVIPVLGALALGPIAAGTQQVNAVIRNVATQSVSWIWDA